VDSESKDIETPSIPSGQSISAGRLPPAADHFSPTAAFVIQAINGCRDNVSLAREIMSIYDLLEQELSKPGAAPVRCLGGGTCCRFDRLEHRLWASCGEIALLLGSSHKPRATSHEGLAKAELVGPACTPARGTAQNGFRARTDALPGRCPWQLGPRCLARQARPLGCRIYFCQKQYDNYFHEIYEKHHDLIRAAHQRYCATYAYADVLDAVVQLSAT
jgi:hypothetical protein